MDSKRMKLIALNKAEEVLRELIDSDEYPDVTMDECAEIMQTVKILGRERRKLERQGATI